MISEHISDDIPPQIKILYMVIPILMHLCCFISILSVTCCIKLHVIQRKKGDIIDDVKLFPAVYRRIYCSKFLMLFNQKSHYKRKCIRVYDKRFYFLFQVKSYRKKH